MPCSDGNYRDVDSAEAKKINELTNLLCSICKYFELTYPVAFFSAMRRVDGLEKWWEKHKKEDEENKKKTREFLRKTALLKLTEEEKQALGL